MILGVRNGLAWCHVERLLGKKPHKKKAIYLYLISIFNISTKPQLHICTIYRWHIHISKQFKRNEKKLKEAFENNTILNLTYELIRNNNITFLDVFVDESSHNFFTALYKKPTSRKIVYLTTKSECLKRYTIALQKIMIYQAKVFYYSDILFYKELCDIKSTIILLTTS